MADVLPNWLLGEHLTYARFQGCTITAGNVVTPGTVAGTSDFSVAASLSSIRMTMQVQHADVRPVNRRQINNVITGEGVGITVVEILKANESVLKNFCSLLAFSFDYIKVTFTRGPNYFVGIFLRGTLRDGVTDHGQNTAEWDLVPVDPTDKQVTYGAGSPP